MSQHRHQTAHCCPARAHSTYRKMRPPPPCRSSRKPEPAKIDFFQHPASACGTDATDVVTTDPGRALVTGHIADAGLFKPPILRDLPVRAPFFHAGSAPDMKHLVNYYNLRFKFGLSASDQADLVNFLNAL